MNKSKNKYLERTIEFHKIYQNEILPILKREEPYRKELNKKAIKYWVFSIFLYILSVVLFRQWLESYDFTNYILPICSVIFFCTAVVLTCLPLYTNDNKIFLNELKIKCLPRILRVFGDIKMVNGSGCVADLELKLSALFADYDLRVNDDEFIGSYNDVDFKITETELFKIYQTKNGQRQKSVFKGIILSFESNKEIKNRTMVATKGDLTRKNTYLLSILPIYCLFMRIIVEFDNIEPIYLLYALLASLPIAWFLAYIFREKEKEPLNEVFLEDPKFHKKFNVYSSDQVEARYLITTSFMDRFQNLKTAFGAKKVKCSFFGNQIMFAISTKKNLFEIANINTPLTDPKTVNELYNELSAIYKMISYFKLDKKIGL